MFIALRWSGVGLLAGLAMALSTATASAVTISFDEGTLSGGVYVEDGFAFSPASLTSGLCPGAPECLLENNGAFSDVEMTTVSGAPFTLQGFSYHFVGDEQQQRSVLTVSDTISMTFTQAALGNDPFTITFGNEFANVTRIVFSYSGPGSARLDDVVAQVIPLPATLPLFLAALGGLGLLARRRRVEVPA